MYLLLSDETNKAPSKVARFFVYGGLILRIDQLSKLHNGIEAIRADKGYRAGDVLKFDTRSRPDHVGVKEATEAKKAVIQACRDIDAVFIAYMILHEIIKNQDPHQQIQWAADHVFSRYNIYLSGQNSNGICIIDNLPERGEFKFLSEKFQQGLSFSDGSKVKLDRIKLFASSCVAASHAMSAMDIVLGSFRYCVNSPQNINAAADIFSEVVELMWHQKDGDDYDVLEKGLILRPIFDHIRVKEYRNEYKVLLQRLNWLLFMRGK